MLFGWTTFIQSLHVTEHVLALVITQVHPVASAVAPVTAVFTFTRPAPLERAMGLVAMLPDIHEVILVNIALVVVGTYAGTGGNGTVGHDRADGNAGLAMEEMIADVRLVFSEITLAAIAGMDATLLACFLEKLEHATELLGAEAHVGVVLSTSYGEDGVDAPMGNTFFDEEIAYGR